MSKLGDFFLPAKTPIGKALSSESMAQDLRQPQRYSHTAFTLPPVLQALQDNANALGRELRAAPGDIQAMFTPEFDRKAQAAMKKTAKINPADIEQMAMDFLQTTPVGAAGMFIGKGAKTWDAAKHADALKMEKAGVDPRKIWADTGNWKAPDGKWRQEIADNTAKYPFPVSNAHGKKLTNVFEHPEMYRSYVSDDISLTIPKGQNLGHYDGANQEIGIPEVYQKFVYGKGKEGDKAYQRAIDSQKSTTLHELQHAIQQREGWAKGGSPEMFAMPDDLRKGMHSYDDMARAEKLLERATREGVPVSSLSPRWADDKVKAIAATYEGKANGLDMLRQNMEQVSRIENPHEAYLRLLGEAEARATQARMHMDMPQRLSTFPADSYDVPLDSVIVRYGDGPAMHTVYHGSPHKFDKFDMSKIGTGEGAQAYGHGLYMAESPEVAQTYRRQFGSEFLWRELDNALPNSLKGKAPDFTDAILSGKNFDDLVSSVRDPWKRTLLQQNKAKIESIVEAHKAHGNIYKVDIPDEAIPRMLDWDKPLSEQSQHVIDALAKSKNKQVRAMLEYAQTPYSADIGGEAKTMGEAFRLLNLNLHGRSAADSAKASALLAKQGIPGIRYLDGGSRAAGEGTSNFVLFDDQLPRILPKRPVFDWSPGGGAKTKQIGPTAIDYGISRDGTTAEVVLVKTPKSQQGQGHARKAMEAFLQEADANGMTVFLTAEPMGKGVSKAKLTDFYRSLGFVPNHGKNKDFRSMQGMVRTPRNNDSADLLAGLAPYAMPLGATALGAALLANSQDPMQ